MFDLNSTFLIPRNSLLLPLNAATATVLPLVGRLGQIFQMLMNEGNHQLHCMMQTAA